MKKVKVTLYRITKRNEYGSPTEWQAIYEGQGISMGDIIRQANAKGICCHDLDYCISHPKPEDYEDTDWNYDFDLDNLDLEGLYIDGFPCAHSDNYITGANLKKAHICLIRPKCLSLVKCDLRGAYIEWDDVMYETDYHDSLMDEDTRIQYADGCQTWSNMKGTLLEKNGLYQPIDNRIIYFDDNIVHAKLIEEIQKYYGKVVDSITDDCNIVIVENARNLSPKAKAAKDKGIGIWELDDAKFIYCIRD